MMKTEAQPQESDWLARLRRFAERPGEQGELPKQWLAAYEAMQDGDRDLFNQLPKIEQDFLIDEVPEIRALEESLP